VATVVVLLSLNSSQRHHESKLSASSLLSYVGFSRGHHRHKEELSFRQFPQDPEGIIDLVKALSSQCFDSPEEEQAYTQVNPQLYR
jgi:hypothetical protein